LLRQSDHLSTRYHTPPTASDAISGAMKAN
jgi:hypothetical protein